MSTVVAKIKKKIIFIIRYKLPKNFCFIWVLTYLNRILCNLTPSYPQEMDTNSVIKFPYYSTCMNATLGMNSNMYVVQT